ncbi:LuxR family transcriptional regulator [Kitasatospora sp. MMS16-BH015]|uniref:helix-turn-helix transcriptional regulator n=1 Tax=Kitasatospora sp. MMS16-BH015 TaxID=2018025 RepID=UPI000CA24D29|nr:LuxR family transcriptional regulator [Kitasatospora sp. MMS16-BH015]AUG76329.1 LuxR family transcriptional regulator [Kitasatospora sp. MMS16-BH015]
MRATSPTTVGREIEVALLADALTGAQQSVGRAVFLVGEAGIGKSRLAGECATRAAAAGLAVLRGRGSATGVGTPYRPLIEAVCSRFRTGGPPEVPELAPYRRALGRLVPEWRAAEPGGRPETVVELAEALLRLLAVVAAPDPAVGHPVLDRPAGCVLLLDDFHDADSETIAVVEYLVDNLASLPVLLVATLRPEPGEALALVRAAERRRVATVRTLGPLAAPEVRAVAAACLETAPAEVPPAVVERLVDGGGGNPYLVEELLAELIASGALRPDAAGRTAAGGMAWEVAGDLTASVPATVVRHYTHRLDQLGRTDPQLRELLLFAALLGTRFSVGALQSITGHDSRTLFAHLRTVIEAEFLVPDPAEPDQYAFRHALTVEALLTGTPLPERAALARQAAAALREADPALGEDRCQLVAELLLTAGDRAGAARNYAEAGRRALAAGAAATAVLMLERGHRHAAEEDRSAIAESLLGALAEAGHLDRALALVEELPTVGAAALALDRRIALHTRLAWAAVVAERAADTRAQIAAARTLLGDFADPAQTAALAVIEGHLALFPGRQPPAAEEVPVTPEPVDGAEEGRGRKKERDQGEEVALSPRSIAERRAREAAEVAERSQLPVVACQAWQLLAMLARERGFDDADRCLERMLAIAESHGLPGWRFEALVRIGANTFMRTGDPRRLEQAREAAAGLGSQLAMQRTEALLAMNAVLRGEHDTAATLVARHLEAAARMRNHATHRYLLVTSATQAAHRGRRREMERALLSFEQEAGGTDSLLTPVMLGLCRTFCALLEEDRPLALAELAATAAWEDAHPNVFFLAGRYGLRPLLDVLTGRSGRPELTAVAAAPAAGLVWNRQFLALAEAVQLGKEGDGAAATRAVEVHRAGGQLFPMAHHLGLRLVAEAALADGWGEPVEWLREAEEYFHALEVPAVAGACRALLRQAGASVAQRRTGHDQIPAQLRALGVTSREYEVLALLIERPANQEIARRLSISPRTVEKHMASLLRKTGHQDRTALTRLATTLSPGG